MKSPSVLLLLLLAASLLLPSELSAHPGHPHPEWDIDEFDELASSFLGGAAHPFSGIDHLLVAIAAGVIAATARKREGRLFGAFLGSLALGFVVGTPGSPAALAGLVSGFALAAWGILALSRSTTAAMALILAAMGFSQGAAHGLPAFSEAAGAGLLVGTTCAAGIGALGFAFVHGARRRARASARPAA